MSRQHRALLVGGGGVGTIAGFNLEASEQARVTFILRSNYDAVLKDGFVIDSYDNGKVEGWRPLGGILRSVPEVRDNASLSDGVAPFDWVICCTKNIPDVGPKLEDIIRPSVTPGVTTIVLIQNGLGIEKPFLSAFPQNICLSGISFCGVDEPTPGYILHKDPDVLTVSAFPNPAMDIDIQHQKARDFVSLYAASGRAKANFEVNVEAIRWRKLLFNAVYNPICALVDLDTSRIRLMTASGPPSIIEELLKPAMQEIRAAALAVANVTLSDEEVEAAIHGESIRSFSMPSMQQDVRKDRFIEHEVILGEVVRTAKIHGVAVPMINTLYQLCRAIQFRTMERKGSINVDDLVESYSSSRIG